MSWTWRTLHWTPHTNFKFCMFPTPVAIAPDVAEEDPCEPNPCGPNTLPPRQNGRECQCTCLPAMLGAPPNCRPECEVNPDCPVDRACISRRCVDPCPGLCGTNAECRVRDHVPICVCRRNYDGDPFSQCLLITSEFYLWTILNCQNFFISVLSSILHSLGKT